MRLCTKCNEYKSATYFPTRGNGKLHSWCKPCHKKYDHERYKNNKDRIKSNNKKYRKELIEWEREIKTKTPCFDCKQNFHYSIMQWDHLPEFTKIDSPMYFCHIGSKNMALEEMKKCNIVCANCHAYRTWQRKNMIQ